MKILTLVNTFTSTLSEQNFADYVTSLFDTKSVQEDYAYTLDLSIVLINESDKIDWFLEHKDSPSFNKTPKLLLFTSSEKTVNPNFSHLKFDGIKNSIIDYFVLPHFKANFNTQNEITNLRLSIELLRKINHLKQTSFKMSFQKAGKSCGIINNGHACDDSCDY